MAEKKFSQLTAKGATIADTDLVAISEDAGGGTYTTKSVTGANIKGLVTDANLTTTDITTNDVSTSKHGFAPKAPNDTTKFLRGDATWAVVPAGGLTKFTEAESTTSPNGTVYVDSLTAAGSTTNVDVAIVPKGTGAFMLDIPDSTSTGGNKRGANAIDIQNARTTATQVASGSNSVVIGSRNTASGTNDTAIGFSNGCTSGSGNNFAYGWSNSVTGDSHGYAVGLNTAISGFFCYALGNANTISGSYGATSIGTSNTSSNTAAFTIGNSNTANSANSFVFGNSGHSFGVQLRQVYGGGAIGTAGDAQKSLFILKQRTTGNTATTLTVNNTTADATNQVILSNNSAYRFKGTIIGKKSGTTDVAAWDVDGIIVRGANAASTTLAVSTVTLVQNTPAWGTPTLAADTTNGGLQVQVTGAATTNIQWTATIETTEVIYA